jgi:plastocyanin
VDAALKVQGTATVRVNQVTASIRNTPALPDTLKVGVSGRRTIVAQALDRNSKPIPNRTFGFRSADPAIATVDAAGIVTGVGLGFTFVVDSVDGFKDSVRIGVVPAPPALLQWGFDSLAVGNGGSVSVPLTLSRTDPAPVIVLLVSSDSMIARAAGGCPGGSLKRVQIPANTAATSLLLCGLSAGRVTLVAQDSAGMFLSDTMIVTVVSTIEFREIGQFYRQGNFYVNKNETHRAQVFLSDPAPAGGLGVTFVYGRAGTSAVSPAPAIIPAGQLSATVTLQGLAPGRDSVVPTSGGFVGRFAYVDVAPDSLRLSIPYPYAVGVGQTMQPYAYYTYAMDHPLLVSLSLSPAIGVVQDTVTVPTNSYYAYLTVKATAVGTATLTATAPGWVGTSGTITFTTPQLGAGGSTSMVAGDPTKGSWYAYTQDSIVRYAHPVVDTVLVTATSRDTTVVAVDVAVGKVGPGQSSVSVLNTLRAQPGGGGRSTWIDLRASGYRPDSFLVNVTAPALTFAVSYPSQVMLGGKFQNAGYVQIPYARSDSFTVVFSHTRRGIVSGPDSVTIPKGQTFTYFDIAGDTVAVDTIRIARAIGYTIPAAQPITVVPIHVQIGSQPSTLYTISKPQVVTAYVRQETYPYYANPLVAPLRVALASSNAAAFSLDSAGVTISAGANYSNNDTLRVNPASLGNDSGRVMLSAPGSTNDSSAIVRVLPTPLTLSIAYPQQAAYRLRLPNNYVSIPVAAPDTVRVTLTQRYPLADSLSVFALKIPPGQTYSNYFDLMGLDSTGTDTLTAAATGYVTTTNTVAMTPAQVDVQDIGTSHLTTELPLRVTTYLRMRPYPFYSQSAIDTVRFSIVSTDSNVIQIDSAATLSATLGSGTSVVARDQYYGYFKVRFVGSGIARVIVSAPGYGTDTLAPVTVTGPVLHLGSTNMTVGVGQVFQNQYVYADNPVAGVPLVVTLSASDSGLPPASQAFVRSVTSVTIPVGQIYSPYFDLTGQTVGTAQLIARASGYGQATTPVSVGAPQLDAPPTQTLYVGEVPRAITVYTEDQVRTARVVAAPLVVSQTVTAPTVAVGDSISRTIGLGQYTTVFNFRGLTFGSASAIFTASGYKADTMVVTVDSGQFLFGSVPTTVGPNQTAQMYVTLPFTNDSAMIVNLTSSPAGVLAVPATVTIPARATYVYFNVTGVAAGTATVTATAPGKAKAGTSSAIPVGTPKLHLFFTANTNVGQKYTLTVHAEDSLGVARNVAAPLTVTLTSSNPTTTTFDSTSITIPANSYYVTTGITFTQAGGYTITGAAPGYASANTPSTATGALVQMQPANAFAPLSVTVSAGQTVTWQNVGTVPHTTTSDTPAWDITLNPGQTYTRTFSTATGSPFTYHCTIHPTMTGTVVVTP